MDTILMDPEVKIAVPEEAAREFKWAELEILRQSIEEKKGQIAELGKRIETLELLVVRLGSPRVQVQPTYQRSTTSGPVVPRRWSPR